MSLDHPSQLRAVRAFGRELVRVGQRGEYWRVVYFLNGRCQQQRWFLSEAQARGEVTRAVATGRFDRGQDLPPLPDDGIWQAMEIGSDANA